MDEHPAAELSYPGAGLTEPATEPWASTPREFRRFEATVAIGRGAAAWTFATDEVLSWGITRRSGFRVSPLTVTEGLDYRITVGWGPFTVLEPVRVVAVVDDVDRCGFAYGTLHGHPVSGEEAFIVHRDPVGTVFLTLRSLTRAAPNGSWRPAFPVLLLAQRFARRRYLRSLKCPADPR